ncbi:hypothetical protein AGMMS49579_07230 [Spirochaetia bacterium]|nr:hypothetical protein AGMMS49579_07230 [Spirochaetia bacterium]
MLCFFLIIPLYSQEQADEQMAAAAIAKDNKRYFLPAFAEVLGSNGLLFVFNRFVARFDFSFVTADIIAGHFRNPWWWDGDNFIINQFGHPYQGLIYHTAARANGFTFYESLAFDVFGSLTWELFTETDTPSVNDMLTTPIGGAVMGEMFHRLFLEVRSPLALFISPVDALNGVITGRRPKRGRSNIYGITLSTGLEYELLAVRWRGSDGPVISDIKHSGAANLETHIIFGNPFEQQSKTPYTHFELTLGGTIGLPLQYSINMISDGYLFSFSPIDTETKKLSTGLSLHYDVFSGSFINYFNEAIDWTVKYQQRFTDTMQMELKLHAGWSFLSGANMYIREEREYGQGWNFKIFFSIFFPTGGIFSADALLYRMYVFSQGFLEHTGETGPVPGMAGGFDILNIFTLSYRRPVTNSFFIGISDSIYGKFRTGTHFPNTELWTNAVRLFAEWRF